jgi:hypothetical protein
MQIEIKYPVDSVVYFFRVEHGRAQIKGEPVRAITIGPDGVVTYLVSDYPYDEPELYESPEECADAVKHFLLLDFANNKVDINPKTSLGEVEAPDIPINSIEFISVRSANVLENAGINTLQELSQLTRNATLRLKNAGRKTVKELGEILAEHGMKFKD